MRKSEIYDKCVYEIEQALLWGKFGKFDSSGVVLSVTEGKAGPVSRAWGIVYNDPDKPERCTEVHVSYYGESVAFGKLLKEIQSK